MNTEPKKTPKTNPLKALKLPAFLLRNWGWRLLALFLAVALWAGLISQDPTLTRERIFNDVPININNADSLRRNSGLVVVDGLDDLTARLRVEVPQREYATVTSAAYNVRVDLSKVTGVGEQELRVNTTSTTSYGSVQDVQPDTVTVVVDEYVTNYRVPVTVEISGAYPEGFYGSTISLDPSTVVLSGPRTQVDQVARVIVDFDVSRLSARAGKVRTARAMRFVDRDGNEVESDMLQASSADVVLRTIVVEQTLYPTRQIELSTAGLTEGEPAEGYAVKRVSVSPSSIMAAGEEDALALVDDLFTANAVSVEDANETFTQTVRIRKPSEIEYLSTDTVTVTVEIEPNIVSRTFDSAKVMLQGVSSTQKVSVNESHVVMVLTGPENKINNLRSSEVIAAVNVRGLPEGEHDIPLDLYVEGVDVSDIQWECSLSDVHITVAPD